MIENYQESDSKHLREVYALFSQENFSRLRSLKEKHYRPSQNHTLTIVATQGCNVACKSCFRSNGGHRVMDEALLDHVIAYASRHFHSVSITGGEPTEYIAPLITAAKRYPNLRVNITTNAEMLPDSTLDIIGNCKNVYPIISLNGIGNVHDASRHPGSFDNVIYSVKRLRARGIPFGIITVANKTNVAQLISGELAEFINKIGACTLEVFQYYPIGDAKASYDRLHLSSREMTDCINYRNALFQSNSYGFIFNATQLEHERCHRELQVFIDGEVSYCPFSAWGFNKIQIDNSDAEITAKFDQYRQQWDEMVSQAQSFCPLQYNINGYIDFFSNHGDELFKPTGILVKDSDTHKMYCRDRIRLPA